MKKYIFLVFITMLSIACDTDLKPESELTYKGFWDSEEAVISNHSGIYKVFRNYNSTFWKLGELRSDIWGGATLESGLDLDFINNNISTSLVPFSRWANLYGMLHYTNDFIKNAPNVSMDESKKKHMLGQVYGLRAYIYYTMLRTWGKVPVTTEPLAKVEGLDILKKKRSSKKEVLAQIKSDIEKSLEYFGSDNSFWDNSKVYWSKPATLVLKGDVYLWSGKVEGGGRPDFIIAKQALESITGFSLVGKYKDLWGEKNQNNSEFIFTLDYQVNQEQSFYNSVFTGRNVEIDPTFKTDGSSMKGFIVNGGNRYGPSAKVVQLLQNNNEDTRGVETFTCLYKDNNLGVGYHTYEESKYVGAILNKFLGGLTDGLRASYTNIPIYRYADVLLLLAEAKNNLGEDPSTEINKIRERAYAPNVAPIYSNKTQAENTKAILDERLKEFIGEGKRWWDLLRAGENFQYVFDEVSSLTPTDAYKIYLPLTQDMLNDDSALEQTEGY